MKSRAAAQELRLRQIAARHATEIGEIQTPEVENSFDWFLIRRSNLFEQTFEIGPAGRIQLKLMIASTDKGTAGAYQDTGLIEREEAVANGFSHSPFICQYEPGS